MRKLQTHELDRPTVDEFRQREKIPLILVLDDVRSMHNVGSAFRTADAFAIEKVILSGITAQPPHREIHKTALGAEDAVEWTHTRSLPEVLKDYKEKGYRVLALELTSESKPLQNHFEAKEKIVIIAGNEVFGVNDSILQYIDGAIEIPQQGTKHSLNVSVSIGIALWEYARICHE